MVNRIASPTVSDETFTVNDGIFIVGDKTYIPRPGKGVFPRPGPGKGVSPVQTWEGVLPHQPDGVPPTDLNRLKTVPSPHPSDAGGNKSSFFSKTGINYVPVSISIYQY